MTSSGELLRERPITASVSDDLGVRSHGVGTVPYAHSNRKCQMHTRSQYSCAMSTPADLTERADRLRHARERAGFSTARDAAARLGVNPNSYAQHENGNRGIPKDKIEPYARAFKVDPGWLLTGRGLPSPKQILSVPLVGYVGAGAEAHFYASTDEGLGEVDAPPNATDQTRAAEIRGESLGPLFERWLVFYDDVRTPVTPDLIGELCVVGLPDDRVLVKKLQRSRTRGLFHLLSNTEAPIFDQEVAWAAKVKTMRPR